MQTIDQDTERLELLKLAIKKNHQSFFDTVQTIQDENVSNYPIIIGYPTFTNLNIGLLLKEEEHFSFNASTLEELAMKKIIDLEKIDDFRTLYKEKMDSFCIFLLDKPAPQFIFVPYGA